MVLVCRDDVDHGVVEDPSSLVDETSLGDGARDLESLDEGDIGVVDDPSSLVDEASRGIDMDQPHLELCFLRWNDVKTLILIARSAGVVFREATPRDGWNAHCSHVGRLVFERSIHCSRVGRLVCERNAQCFHVARRVFMYFLIASSCLLVPASGSSLAMISKHKYVEYVVANNRSYLG